LKRLFTTPPRLRSAPLLKEEGITHSFNRTQKWIIACLAAALAASAQAGEWIGTTGDGIATRNFEKLLADNPLPAGENIKAMTLHESAHSKHLLVQVRDRESVHYHADSDISVVMLHGHGTIHIGEKKLKAKQGDTIFIPRGAVHWFLNEAKEPAAALVIYSPPPGPNDRVLVETPRKRP
jgi:mannose-6-phosphate isomerase-like protein (cupin superfamily)